MQKEIQRVALVTGASSGIGLACAAYLAARGLRVYGASRSGSSAAGVSMLTMDVTDDASVEAAVTALLRREGRLDIVVNNAGMGVAGPVEVVSVEDAKRQFEVNFFGILRVSRAVLPVMRRQRMGYIVNIGSIAGLIAVPYVSMYSATKFAVEGLSESLRMEVRRFGVRVVVVEPGDHKTAFTQNRQVSGLTAGTEGYRSAMETMLAKAAHDEQSGPAPERIAQLVYRIVNRRNPRLRYTVGPALQRAAIWLKRLGPYSLVELVISKYYGVRR